MPFLFIIIIYMRYIARQPYEKGQPHWVALRNIHNTVELPNQNFSFAILSIASAMRSLLAQ